MKDTLRRVLLLCLGVMFLPAVASASTVQWVRHDLVSQAAPRPDYVDPNAGALKITTTSGGSGAQSSQFGFEDYPTGWHYAFSGATFATNNTTILLRGGWVGKWGIFLSKDGGNTWSDDSHNMKGSFYFATMTRDGSKLFGVSHYRDKLTSVNVSTDGALWKPITFPRPVATDCYTPLTGVQECGPSVSLEGDLFPLTDTGSHLLYADFYNANNAANPYNSANTLSLSNDGGASWHTVLTLPTATLSFQAGGVYRGGIAKVASSRDGMTVVVGVTGGALYISHDGGETWTNRTLAANLAGQANVTLVAVSDDGKKLFAAPSLGYLNDSFSMVFASFNKVYAYLYVSTDGGVTWAPQTAGGAKDWNDLAVSGDGKTLIADFYASGKEEVNISTDNGATWSPQGVAGAVAISHDGTKVAVMGYGGTDTTAPSESYVYLGTLSPNAASVSSSSSGSSTSGFCPTLSNSLIQGSSDAVANGEVEQLQQFLVSYFHLDNSIITGYYGPLTAGYISQFQTQQGITSTGTVGPLTRAAVASVCGSATGAQVSQTATPSNSSVAPVGALEVSDCMLSSGSNLCSVPLSFTVHNSTLAGYPLSKVTVTDDATGALYAGPAEIPTTNSLSIQGDTLATNQSFSLPKGSYTIKLIGYYNNSPVVLASKSVTVTDGNSSSLRVTGCTVSSGNNDCVLGVSWTISGADWATGHGHAWPRAYVSDPTRPGLFFFDGLIDAQPSQVSSGSLSVGPGTYHVSLEMDTNQGGTIVRGAVLDSKQVVVGTTSASVSAPSSASSLVQVTECSNAQGNRGTNNQSYSCHCGPFVYLTPGPVWGTDTYTDDSSICTAALQSGVISTQGGNVTYTIKPGQASYTGTTRNGITSSSFGSWLGSFIFPESASTVATPAPIQSAASIPTQNVTAPTSSTAQTVLGSGLNQNQISAITALLQSFGADQSIITNVQTALGGVAPSPSTTAACLTLSNSLYLDQSDATTGGDVSRLQQYLGGQVTGYFGPATMQLVQAWQASNGVVSSGSPDTTGYGYVGPKTRAAMTCGGVVSQ